MARLKVGVLVSGRGSNLQALIDACATPSYPAELALVIANRPDAPALDRARRAGIAAMAIDHQGFAGREAFDLAIDRVLRRAGVGIVCLAGFMRILSRGFVETWAGRMLNVHPALLPAYRGLHTHARALADGARIHGCTVHLVTPELDAGPILVQAAVPVLESDDEASLAARVLAQEHRCYPLALRLLCEGRVIVEEGRARIRPPMPAPGPDFALCNPLPAAGEARIAGPERPAVSPG